MAIPEINKNKHDHLAKNHDWHDLIETFGMDVACAFRDAAMAYWRMYRPEDESTTSIPFRLVLDCLGWRSNLEKIRIFLAIFHRMKFNMPFCI